MTLRDAVIGFAGCLAALVLAWVGVTLLFSL